MDRAQLLKASSVLALLVNAVVLVSLLLIGALFSPSAIPISVQLGALCLMFWARATLGLRSFHAAANPTAGGLVTRGPYRYIRHPIYTALCLLAWAGIAAQWSTLAGVLGVVLLASVLARMICEEKLLVQRYPEYRQYAATTKRMVPFVY